MILEIGGVDLEVRAHRRAVGIQVASEEKPLIELRLGRTQYRRPVPHAFLLQSSSVCPTAA